MEVFMHYLSGIIPVFYSVTGGEDLRKVLVPPGLCIIPPEGINPHLSLEEQGIKKI